MIITENVTINDVQYKYTKSSLGYYIQRNDGKKFIDAYDKIDSTFTYTELTSSPKPITVQNINFSQLYPIGSIYIGTMAVCPLEVLGIGVWELVSKDRVLQGAGTRGSVDTTIEAGLPNITGSGLRGGQDGSGGGAFVKSTTGLSNGAAGGYGANYTFDASKSNSIYGKSNTVQPPAYIVNIWKRIS